MLKDLIGHRCEITFTDPHFHPFYSDQGGSMFAKILEIDHGMIKVEGPENGAWISIGVIKVITPPAYDSVYD